MQKLDRQAQVARREPIPAAPKSFGAAGVVFSGNSSYLPFHKNSRCSLPGVSGEALPYPARALLGILHGYMLTARYRQHRETPTHDSNAREFLPDSRETR